MHSGVLVGALCDHYFFLFVCCFVKLAKTPITDAVVQEHRPPQVQNGERVFEETWHGLSLVPKVEEHEEMLHDEFYESYWAYKPYKP